MREQPDRVERRSFLKRLGVSVAAVALAPSIVQGLAASSQVTSPITVANGLTVGSGAMDLRAATLPEWQAGPGLIVGIDPRTIEKMRLATE